MAGADGAALDSFARLATMVIELAPWLPPKREVEGTAQVRPSRGRKALDEDSRPSAVEGAAQGQAAA